MARTRSYRREVRNKAIARKKWICHHVYWDGQYSKGKIHCSCSLCTYNKFYDLPRYKDMVDSDRVKDAMKDLYEHTDKAC